MLVEPITSDGEPEDEVAADTANVTDITAAARTTPGSSGSGGVQETAALNDAAPAESGPAPTAAVHRVHTGPSTQGSTTMTTTPRPKVRVFQVATGNVGSEMIKRMDHEGLVTMKGGIRLTEDGLGLAERVVRRHRLADSVEHLEHSLDIEVHLCAPTSPSEAPPSRRERPKGPSFLRRVSAR